MPHLHPTLWRTCKMLAGSTRIRLLRQLHEHPGDGVSALGRRVGIKEAAASQELRRIQSRGLLQSERQGVLLIYRMGADPQVSTAAPILKAIQTALRERPSDQDADMATISFGLANERRIRIVRSLLEEPRPLPALQYELHIPAHPFQAHMQSLFNSGFVIRSEGMARAAVPDHPLAKALAKLIQQGITR